MSENPTPENPGTPEAPETPGAPEAPEAEADGTPDRAFIRDNPEKRRFDVFVGEHHAGFSKYRDVDGADSPQRIFFHTVVFDEYEGRGLASTLTRTALEQTVREGRRIVPVCPYVARWVEHHEEAAPHVDAVRPEHLAAIEQG
ncbi:GNAT family N-acetyltransferase [Brachybacterium sp. ACRRE]|uniref:GNAT family N-acetyltransferase n=1 Tax=Brachybacterium sp. ACRRE TaxID=2918184 RepID=UPI001EF190D7|nr:GNAT family N-acetyltransferase [Brachybacterium sp. ACRRE]MCG7310831.1 N-acetyltransferase [Brachybacterium sp. ACRRE]